MNTPSKNSNIPIIQFLRGVAALLVVFWHLFGLPDFAAGSKLGVDLFFVISGFIMVHATASCDGTLAYSLRFLVRRVIRIYPLWWAAAFAYVLTSPNLLDNNIFLLWCISSVALIPVNLGADVVNGPGFIGAPILGVGWTLNYEMYFYLFFAASMLAGRFRWFALATWLAFTLYLLPAVFPTSGSAYMLMMQNWELVGYFVIGVVIALLIRGGGGGIYVESRTLSPFSRLPSVPSCS